MSVHDLARMGYGEWRRREDRKAEDIRKARDSPACQCEWKVNKYTEPCWAEYRSFENKLVYNLDSFDLPEDDNPYGQAKILRLITVLPEHRKQGYCSRFIGKLKWSAEQTGCLVVAVCSPFMVNVDLDECETDEEKIIVIGHDLTEYSFALREIESDCEFKGKRRGMKSIFLESSWEPINIRDGMKDKRKNGYWSFAYVPTSLDSEFLKKILWRLPQRKRKETTA